MRISFMNLKLLFLYLFLASISSAFEIREAQLHDRIVPKTENSGKIISFYGQLDNAIHSVVSIKVLKRGRVVGAGSGVILSKNGYIVTNAHVVTNADEVDVYLFGSVTKIKARLIGKEKSHDLAVLKINNKNLEPIVFANSDKIQLTDLVFAIGNSFGLGTTISQGIVSSFKKRSVGIYEFENLIQKMPQLIQETPGALL